MSSKDIRRSDYADKWAETCIERLGGKVLDLDMFEEDLQGYGRFLKNTGVKYTNAREITRPRFPLLADKYGYKLFIPPKGIHWYCQAVNCLVFDKCREAVGRPVYIYNAWRPIPYNEHGGARYSDHTYALALDCLCRSVEDRRKFEREAKRLRRYRSYLKISLGLGDKEVHLGVLTDRSARAKSHREWHYNDYVP